MPSNEPSHVTHERKAEAQLGRAPITCSILTISDTRKDETDRSGAAIAQALQTHGHDLHTRTIVPDDTPAILRALDEALAAGVVCIIATGGTGISPRDHTVEALRPRLEQELEGFGELFRMLSFKEVGAAAMLSRAFGGIVCANDGKRALLFALPGSTNAVRLALDQLILPQLPHLCSQLRGAQ